MIMRSPDGQFQIGRPRRDRRLVVGGCSGHAFKHASGIGEVSAQVVCDETPLIQPDLVDPNRFCNRARPIMQPLEGRLLPRREPLTSSSGLRGKPIVHRDGQRVSSVPTIRAPTARS